jgi:hypothetical protein
MALTGMLVTDDLNPSAEPEQRPSTGCFMTENHSSALAESVPSKD